ncbi:MAG: TonB-dependent receptor [Candidatus Aminicenantes bacterium]|nr:TonB-dependent receptor [Candidatus Aminicenantes bacterium]
MNFAKRFALLAISLLLCAGLLTAQTSTAKIFGVVQLEDGSLVPGVNVEATSPKLVGKTTAVSDENGAFRLFNLAPGIYKLVFTLQGFQTVIRDGIQVGVEQTLSIKVSMKLGNIEEMVTITGQVAQIDVKSTVKGMTLTKEVFQTLPKGRNFDSLITAIPGVSNEPMLGGTSIDGATGLENMYYIDGTDVTNIVSGAVGQSASFDFVDEVQIKASGYSAEFGGSLGGVINVVTRSGGNEFHGEVLAFYSGAALRADYSDRLDYDRKDTSIAKYFAYDDYIGKNNDTRLEGGFNVGGYIFKDKLWFFGSFLPIYYTNTRTVDFGGAGTTIKDFKRTENYWNFMGKLTAQPIKNLRLTASVVNNYYKYKGNLESSFGNANATVSPDDYGITYPNFSASASADYTVGNNFMLSVRGGMFTSNAIDPLVAPVEAFYRFSTEAPGGYFGTSNASIPGMPPNLIKSTGYRSASAYPYSLVKNLDEKFSVNADMTYFLNLAGEHSFKAGVQFVRQGQNYDESAIFPIVFLAWDRSYQAYGTDYGRGTYGYYSIRGAADAGPFGDFYKAYSNRYALYLQDSWTIANRVTINLGVRAEAEYIPSYSDNPDFADVKPIEWGFADKLAPRLGFVWDVKGDSTLKVFGSAGLFYDVMKLEMAAGSYGGFKWKSAIYPLNTVNWDQIGKEGWSYPAPLAVFDFRVPSFDSTDTDMKSMSQMEISFGVEKKLKEDLAFTARFVNKNLLWAIEDIGILYPDGEHYYTTNPGSDFIKERWIEAKAAGMIPQGAPDIPKAKRLYYALNLSLDKRFSNNWMGGVSYTWSRLTGNYSGLASGDEYGRTSPNVERYFDLWYLAFDKDMNKIDGVMPGDRTHYLKLYGSYTMPMGLTFGTVINAMSGTPVSTEYSMDVQGYLPFNRGDLGRTPFFWFANLYAEYNLKLGKNNLNISVNVDNVFNTRTAQRIYQIYNNGGTAPSYEEVLSTNWEIADIELDPLFKKEMWFYGDAIRGTPLAVRLGFKFSF